MIILGLINKNLLLIYLVHGTVVDSTELAHHNIENIHDVNLSRKKG